MDVEKLIDRLWQHNKDWGDGRTQNFFQVCLDCKSAAEALTTLQIELKAMRGAANSYKAENARLESELEKVKAERDAAVECIPHECKTCVYHTVFFNGCTPDHDCTNPDGGCSNNYDRWQWRGMEEEG